MTPYEQMTRDEKVQMYHDLDQQQQRVKDHAEKSQQTIEELKRRVAEDLQGRQLDLFDDQ